jgi:drug/metabolite transporter (DMT)-like permease
VLVCVVTLAIGQLLFKLSANSTLEPGVSFSIRNLATNPWFVASLLLYGSATLLWVWILRSVPLSVAYPFFALSFVFVPFLGQIILGEEVNQIYWVGIGLIVLGVTFTAL